MGPLNIALCHADLAYFQKDWRQQMLPFHWWKDWPSGGLLSSKIPPSLCEGTRAPAPPKLASFLCIIVLPATIQNTNKTKSSVHYLTHCIRSDHFIFKIFFLIFTQKEMSDPFKNEKGLKAMKLSESDGWGHRSVAGSLDH